MIGVVFVGEYLRRVKTKAFVLTTLLAPIAIIGVMAGAVAIIFFSIESERERERTIAVHDESGRLLPVLLEEGHESFTLEQARRSVDEEKQAVIDGRVDGLLVLPAELAEVGASQEAWLYLKEKQSITAEQELRSFVRRAMREVRLERYDLPPEVQQTMYAGLDLNAVALTEEGEEEAGSAAVPAVVGMIVAVVVLMIMWTYGAIVMQTAMEEKSSRMAEILVSSVRPFDLLMGKILAVGGMAATQLAAWMLMFGIVGIFAALFMTTPQFAELGIGAAAGEAGGLPSLPSIRFDVVVTVLLMVPLGYLLNASVFGAVGALYETPQEAQVAVTIVMLPMILTIVMVQTVGMAPNSPFVVIGSFFPFTAPAMLPTRMLITDVPLWQVLASFAICIASALGLVWVAGRVFRGALLTYGKKPSLRDIRNVLLAD